MTTAIDVVFCKEKHEANRSVSTVVKILISVREVWGSNAGSVKSGQGRQRCDISSELCCEGANNPTDGHPFVTRFGTIPRV